MVAFTESAGRVSAFGQHEARRLHHRYLGPEHLLLGILLEGDNLAARVLVAHGLDLETVRAEVDQLIAQGLLPGPQPSDSELLATLGVDLEVVHGRVKATFGDDAYRQAAQHVRHRPTQSVMHRAVGGPPLTMCRRSLRFAADEAVNRAQDIGPEHLLLGLLRDAQDPIEADLYPQERQQRAQLGLPNHGPHPIRLLIEARGLTLDDVRAALLRELDPDQGQ
jgi:ATP-dependent Clp protease ATP-binding subunit ClpA